MEHGLLAMMDIRARSISIRVPAPKAIRATCSRARRQDRFLRHLFRLADLGGKPLIARYAYGLVGD